MTIEHKKLASKTIRELYLYPYRSKGENAIRCAAWMASWIVGIVLQSTLEPKALGSAYLIFATSLMLEFVPESKEVLGPKVIHGLFCLLLFAMLIGAVTLSFADTPTAVTKPHWLYSFSVKALPCIGWILCAVMTVSLALTFIEAHKLFYDEKAEKEREAEDSRKLMREQFEIGLRGPSKGGNA